MTAMTDARAVEVLAAMREDGGAVADADYTAAIDHAIARLRGGAEAQAQDGGEVAAWKALGAVESELGPLVGMVHDPDNPVHRALEAAMTALNQRDTAPPSAPVGELASALQSMRDRMMAALPPKFGDAFDGDFDTLLEAINSLKGGRRQNLEALAQQPAAAWQAIVEACVITEAVTPDAADPRGTLHRLIDYHVALDRDQQPAAVDGAMPVLVELVATLAATGTVTGGRIYFPERQTRELLKKACDALAAQPGGSDNDR